MDRLDERGTDSGMVLSRGKVGVKGRTLIPHSQQTLFDPREPMHYNGSMIAHRKEMMMNRLRRPQGDGGWWLLSFLAGPLGVVCIVTAVLLLVIAVMI